MVWENVAKLGDLEDGQGVMCPVRGRPIGLWRVGDHYFAMDDRCPHRGALLSEGEYSDGKVTCPWHAWQFDLKTGALLDHPDCSLKTYPVKVQGGDIYIQVENEDGKNLSE